MTFAFKIPTDVFQEWYEIYCDHSREDCFDEWKKQTEDVKGFIGVHPCAFGFHYFLFLTKKGRDAGARIAKDFGLIHIVKVDTPEFIDVQQIIEAQIERRSI